MRMAAGLVSHFALAGIGSLAFTAFTPQATLAAPGITLKGSFDGTNGAGPFAALTSDGNGKFYGTTSAGGANGNGAIFEFNPANGSITLKSSFNNTNGAFPYAALTSTGNGNFYGTTYFGGANNKGTIFEFDPSGNAGSGSINLKGSVDSISGANPFAALTSDGNGKFYGTTFFGGTNNDGAIFEFNPSGNAGNGSITLKSSFDFANNGAGPFGTLTSAGNGKFYGTTTSGGANGDGAIFEFDPTSGAITLKGSFDSTNNGAGPIGGLTSAGNGKFYGTTEYGGANDRGAIFEFDPSGSGSITLKGSFDRINNGAGPYAALTSAGNGRFYGTTTYGGANNKGTIFEFDPSGNGSITLKGTFDGTNGAAPHAALVSAGNGIFYGSTVNGGANNNGTIFEFDPGANNVPAPLPVIGAGAAFGWSRRLRRRIQQARPVVPMGR